MRRASRDNRAVSETPAIYDRYLFFAAMSLILIGLLMVASSSIVISEQYFHQPFHYLLRQSTYLTLGLLLALIILRIPMHFWETISSLLLVASMILLVLVLIPGLGHSVNGSMRWLGIPSFRLQVSEVAKLAIIVYMAGYIVRHREQVRERFIGFLKPMIIIVVIMGLLLKEPDFGAVVVILMTVLGMMFLAGVRLWQFATLLSVAAGFTAVLAVSSPYRLARLTSFLDPWANQFDSGYQLTQSLIAFGRGSWFGVGLGESIQKLFYLPEAHTDFLFAVLAEELGLVGVLLVIFLFALLVQRSFLIARRALRSGQIFSAYISYGFGLLLGFQAMINMGVNVGILPTKGLTLPLMSYGGSSMLVNCIIIAILLRVDYESRNPMTT